MNAEPSMEEILSSIKRIIAEEGDGPVRPRRAARPVASPPLPVSQDDDLDSDLRRDLEEYRQGKDDSVLELSDPIDRAPEVDAPSSSDPETTPLPSPPEPVVQDAVEPPTPAPAPTPETSIPKILTPEPIISDRAAEASRNAIDQLTRTIQAAAPADAVPTGDTSLEGLVREMLRPMLRDWLDARLPAMIEQIVAKEIARITDGTR